MSFKTPFDKTKEWMLLAENSHREVLLNCSENENIGLKNRKGKPGLALRRQKKVTGFHKNKSKSQSTEEEKVLNTVSHFDTFMGISNSFVDVLNQLQIDSGNHKYVLEELSKIKKIVKEKILFLKLMNLNEDRRERNASKLTNLMYLKSESSLKQSLLSEKSTSEINLEFNLAFLKFLIRVNCPFCSEPQDDKINLIKHLDKSCQLYISKKFKKKDIPFSVFQILPNNKLRCNICSNSLQYNVKNYFWHLHSNQHILTYTKVSKVKYYSEFLFCSCCKIQVPDNHTQINLHINHQFHKNRSELLPSSEYFSKRGIRFMYLKNKRFRCLDCPKFFCQSPKEILEHFNEQRHRKNVSNLFKLFCEFCSKEVHVFEIFDHLALHEHEKREIKETLTENYELCLFCGFGCGNLMELSQHMEVNCTFINDIRKQILNSDKSPENDLKGNKAKDKSNIDGGYIIIKDYENILELFRYFKKFGEITSVEAYDGKDVLIKFQEKSTVEDILLLREVLKINKVKLEITTDDKSIKSPRESVSEEKNKKESLHESENSYSSDSEEEESNDKESDEDSNLNETDRMENELQSLFQRVSSHFIKNVPKLDLAVEEKLITDCAKTFNPVSCSLVGFLKCGLLFPIECISLYCELRCNKESEGTAEVCSSLNYIESCDLIILQSLREKMCASKLWENVINCFDSSFPYIKCKHKETQKTCTVTFMKSAMILTDILIDLKENPLVESFCLIFRFWLTLHELKIGESEYVIISLFIFFVISMKITNISFEKYYTPEALLLRNTLIQDDPNLNKNSSPIKSTEVLNIVDLFHKFLEFLSTFEFYKFVIYLPLPCPVPRELFWTKLKTGYLLRKPDSKQVLDFSMCIIEPLSLLNLASDITEEDVKSLVKIAKRTIKSYRM